MSKSDQWVIFDADNTLWNIERLYNEARAAFCKYVRKQADGAHSSITEELLDQAQRHRDIQLKRTHGYSASRFARSFEDTATFFFPFISPENIIYIRKLALDVFETAPVLVDGLEETLELLQKQYALAIITAGERWVQERRLNDFNFRDQFQKILVVERKTPAVLNEFCERNAINRQASWMVGDSVISDIQPAVEAGLNAIHINNENWQAETGRLPAGISSVTQIREILPILLSSEN